MNEMTNKLRQIEEALRWRREYSRGFGDRRDQACVRFWSDEFGYVTYMLHVLFEFHSMAEFAAKADALIEEKRHKTALERVDWGSAT